MDLVGLLKSFLVIAAGVAMTVLFYRGIYTNLRQRFGWVRPYPFIVFAIFLTVAPIAFLIWFTDQPRGGCGMLEVGVVRSFHGDPLRQLLGERRESAADPERARRLCRSYWQKCQNFSTERTRLVNDICIDVTASDAEIR